MKKFTLLIITLSLFSLAGCASSSANKQALAFWQAVENENFDDAARLTINPSPTKLRILTTPFRDMSAQIIDSKVEDNKAVALTKLSMGANSEYLMTIMVKHQGQWLIDEQAMLKSAITYRLNRFADDISSEANNLLEQAMTDLESSWKDIEQELNR